MPFYNRPDLPQTITIKKVVADQTALLALTIADVQNGDYVQQTSPSILYVVTDQTQLGTLAAFTATVPLTHTHTGGADAPKLAQANTHETPDTDSATTSLHHTLGTGANQAAAGDHNHSGVYDPAGSASTAQANAIAMIPPVPYYRILDQVSTVVAGTTGAFWGAVNASGTAYPRPLLFYQNSTVVNSNLTYISREQSQYLWKGSDSYWYISAAIGSSTDSLKSSSTSDNNVVAGTYTGQGTFAGKTMTLARGDLPSLATTSEEVIRPINTATIGAALVVPPVITAAPSHDFRFKLSLCQTAGTTSKTMTLLFQVRESRGSYGGSPATPFIQIFTLTLASGVTTVAYSDTIPNTTFSGKPIAVSAIAYDSDMATPTLGGTCKLSCITIGMEYV